VGECFFWYRLTRVVPDKGPQKRLLLLLCFYRPEMPSCHSPNSVKALKRTERTVSSQGNNQPPEINALLIRQYIKHPHRTRLECLRGFSVACCHIIFAVKVGAELLLEILCPKTETVEVVERELQGRESFTDSNCSWFSCVYFASVCWYVKLVVKL